MAGKKEQQEDRVADGSIPVSTSYDEYRFLKGLGDSQYYEHKASLEAYRKWLDRRARRKALLASPLFWLTVGITVAFIIKERF